MTKTMTSSASSIEDLKRKLMDSWGSGSSTNLLAATPIQFASSNYPNRSTIGQDVTPLTAGSMLPQYSELDQQQASSDNQLYQQNELLNRFNQQQELQNQMELMLSLTRPHSQARLGSHLMHLDRLESSASAAAAAVQGIDKEHISSLAVNLSHQMEYNNALLLQIETLEAKNSDFDEKTQLLETEKTQMRAALRVSTEQTLQLERRLENSSSQYDTVLNENRMLREQLVGSSEEVIRLSAQVEAQKRRRLKIEEGSTSGREKISHLESKLMETKNSHKAEIDKLSRHILSLETSLKRTELTVTDKDSNHIELQVRSWTFGLHSRNIIQ